MKTQIITLASHDDLISIRDRMSWAKAPRILLVWPPREQVTLQPLDLRILQQHARDLGADLALVARGERTRRDARAFGIPVFRTTVEAQRQAWPVQGRRSRRRLGSMRARLARLRELQTQARPRVGTGATSGAIRMGSFVLAVLSVCAIALLFVPRADIVLHPEIREQSLTLTVDVGTGQGVVLEQGAIPAQLVRVPLSGTQSRPVVALSEVAVTKASGIAQIQNVSAAALLVPSGTVVYSSTPGLARFVTLQDVQLDTGANNIVDVPIEAIQAGAASNLPPDSIEGAEGSLSASVQVTNPEPIAGGSGAQQSVPSQAERDQLRADLEQRLQVEAQEALQSTLQAGDLLLPATLSLASVDRETFDPPPGQSAGVLSLKLEATFQIQYIRSSDLRALSAVALDAQLPSGYVPKEGTLRIQVNHIAGTGSGRGMQLELDLRRTLNRSINLMAANQLVRGASPGRAVELLDKSLPLADSSEIRLTPDWWPWLPLIPFRIDVAVQ
jgi:hypothetical protein